jgi:phage-related baseplate assembly protein
MASIMAATYSSSTVDLSRLAAPTIVEQVSYEDTLAEILTLVKAKVPAFDATVDSDPAVKILQIAAYLVMLSRQQFNDAAQQLMVAYATGARLDHLGALFGVARLVIVPADAQTDAAAIYEDDAAYRQRIVLAPEGFSVAGPELAYVKHAKDASGDVLDASATSPAPGEVLVSVLSRVGNGSASVELLAAVRAIVTADTIRPIGDFVTVASAQLVDFAIVAGLTTFTGPDINVVIAAAQTALAAYLAENRRLGRNINRAGIIAALKVPGVENVTLTNPPADVVCTLAQAANATAITVTHAGYAG